jgi:hypothetical protein
MKDMSLFVCRCSFVVVRLSFVVVGIAAAQDPGGDK